jgi:hypothetical protein
MGSLVQPLAALSDPIDGVRLAVEARRWLWSVVAMSLRATGSRVAFAVRWNAEPVIFHELDHDGELNQVGNVAQPLRRADPRRFARADRGLVLYRCDAALLVARRGSL